MTAPPPQPASNVLPGPGQARIDREWRKHLDKLKAAGIERSLGESFVFDALTKARVCLDAREDRTQIARELALHAVSVEDVEMICTEFASQRQRMKVFCCTTRTREVIVDIYRSRRIEEIQRSGAAAAQAQVAAATPSENLTDRQLAADERAEYAACIVMGDRKPVDEVARLMGIPAEVVQEAVRARRAQMAELGSGSGSSGDKAAALARLQAGVAARKKRDADRVARERLESERDAEERARWS